MTLTTCWLTGVLGKLVLCPDVTDTWIKVQIHVQLKVQTYKDTGIQTTAVDADGVLVDRGTGEGGLVSSCLILQP